MPHFFYPLITFLETKNKWVNKSSSLMDASQIGWINVEALFRRLTMEEIHVEDCIGCMDISG